MAKSPRREKMSPAPTSSSSSSSSMLKQKQKLSASELAEHFDDLNATGAPKSSTSKSLQPAYSSSPRQQQHLLDQSFLAFRAAGSTSSLLSSSSSGSPASSERSHVSQEDDFVLNNSGRSRHRQNQNQHPHMHHHTQRQVASASKERYVFSNFRFLIRQNARIPAVDDALDWLDIEMVLVPEIESHLCPICLDLPRFPRFTRCGHIYCLPCILQYFQTSDAVDGMGSNWRTCPVCAELVHLKQLRPVHFCPATEARLGQPLRTILLEKPVGSLYPRPLNSNATAGSESKLSELSPFQRLIPVSARFVVDEIWTPELKQARQELKILGSQASFESTFLEATVNFIDERRKLKMQDCDSESESAVNTSTKSPTTNNTSNANAKGNFYFHQARDGLNVFLHPLCMKILHHHFHSYPQIPGDLSLPVVECERVVVDSWNRKRFKYLDHLPLGTQIILAEVDLSSCVSSETLAHFARDLAAREQARLQRTLHEAHTQSRSILQEWRQMEDEYYLGVQASSAIDIVAPPEMVKLDDLADEASFPLPSSLPSRMSHSASQPRRPSIPSSQSFAAAAASPPSTSISFSDLATSLGSPFFHHNNNSNSSNTLDPSISESLSASASAIVSGSSNIIGNSTGNSSPGKSFADALSPPSTNSSGKKKGIVLSSTAMQRR